MGFGEITAAWVNDVGRVRENQEDSYVLWLAPDGEAASGLRAVAAVADGMGGHQAGEVASALVAQRLQDYLCAFADQLTFGTAAEVSEYLHELIADANAAVHRLGAQIGGMRPGTTLTCAVVWRDQLVLAHVGDSRAYLVRGMRCERMTRDHTYVADQIRQGLMTSEQARTSPLRNSLIRCIGVEPEVRCDLSTRELLEGDLLVLCSDGLSEYVQDAELAEVVASRPLEAAVDDLKGRALERGGHDNVTVVALQCGARVILPEGAELDLAGEGQPVPEAPEPPAEEASVAGEPPSGVSPGVLALIVLVVFLVVAAAVPRLVRRPPGPTGDTMTSASTSTATTVPPPPRTKAGPGGAASKVGQASLMVLFSSDGKDVVIGSPTGGLVVEGGSGYTVERTKEGNYRVRLLNAAQGQAFVLVPKGGGVEVGRGLLSTRANEASFHLTNGQYELRVGGEGRIVALLTVTTPGTQAAPSGVR
ncbi:MAG: serine/threonine-protein phosphatase [Armatimonadetes bacterium]|nr:serine/threonine-protein phosphatase [Armatimonadota bacterium]